MDVEKYLDLLKERFKQIDTSKYYLSYSGGKDSHLLYWFIKEYAKIDGIEVVGVDTFMEHDEILARIYKNADVVLKPKLTPFEIKEKCGIPCFSKYQDSIIFRYQNGSRAKDVLKALNRNDGAPTRKYKLNATAVSNIDGLHRISSKCDYYNKKQPLAQYEKESGKKGIIGVRCEESQTRKDNYKSCFTKKGLFAPIFDLSNEMQEAIYKAYNIEVPSLYNYLDRTGCMGCPYGNHGKTTVKELALLEPTKRQDIIELFKESYDVLGIDYKNIMPKEYYKDCNNPIVCKYCGAIFEKGRNTIYCSGNCQRKDKAIIRAKAICKVCGKAFVPHNFSKGLCCSRKCGAIYRHGKKQSTFYPARQEKM